MDFWIKIYFPYFKCVEKNKTKLQFGNFALCPYYIKPSIVNRTGP